MKTRMIGVMSPLSTWVLMRRSIRLPGASATAAPIRTWTVNSERNSGPRAKRARHRSLDSDGLGDGVGGREGHDCAGERGRAEQADGEQVRGEAAGDRLERPGRVLGRVEGLAQVTDRGARWR